MKLDLFTPTMYTLESVSCGLAAVGIAEIVYGLITKDGSKIMEGGIFTATWSLGAYAARTSRETYPLQKRIDELQRQHRQLQSQLEQKLN